MKRIDTDLPGVFLIEPRVFGDERGFFYESYNQRVFADLGIACPFVQDNHSRSTRDVLRGLHHQIDRPQDKLVRVTQGEVYDVTVDVRRGSPTFGRWTAVRLSAENRLMLFVPRGFAHGFLVTSEVCEFQYKVSDAWSPAGERGIAWNDPDLAIPWPLAGAAPIVSAKDAGHRPLAEQADADLPAPAP